MATQLRVVASQTDPKAAEQLLTGKQLKRLKRDGQIVIDLPANRQRGAHMKTALRARYVS